jgi:hypothetical protein
MVRMPIVFAVILVIPAPCLAQQVATSADLPAEASATHDAASDDPAAKPAEAEPDAPPAATDAQALAKQLANPIANLISVPFQENVDFGLGDYGPGLLHSNGVKSTLNIQPVIPISLTKDWNVIVRTIVPVIWQNDIAPTLGRQFGLGDITQSFFFSPKKPTAGGIVWGAGPVFLYRTATQPAELLGTQKWGAGATFVVLKQSKGWTVGALANHIWSVAGSNERDDISATYMQPFINYTWPTSVSVGLDLETTYNWVANEWTVPINATVSRVVKIGKQPNSLQAGVRYYVESPVGGPHWGLRSNVTLLFPKRPKR